MSENDPWPERATIPAIHTIAVTGGRGYHFDWRDYEFMNQQHHALKFTSMLNGGASGADSYCKRWAYSYGILVKERRPDWAKYGKQAGPIRNSEMAKEAQALLAFPGGDGTADMVAKCLAK